MLDQGLVKLASTIGDLISAGLQLAERLGQRDAFLEALDGVLATGRRATDEALRRKHGGGP